MNDFAGISQAISPSSYDVERIFLKFNLFSSDVLLKMSAKSIDRDATRPAAPHRILDDVGSAFSMGFVGGFLWNFAKGLGL